MIQTTRRRLLQTTTLVPGAALLSTRAAHAQAFPSKPVRIICAFAPGGTIDVISRAIAPSLSDVLGQSVVVENRPGAGGWIGTQQVARAAPDGYTLLLSSSGVFTIAPLLYRDKIGFDPLKDFVSIGLSAEVPLSMLVGPSLSVKTALEFVSHAKANPGQVKSATAGNGTTNHLLSVLFEQATGTKLNLIPYKGSGQSLTDLIGGHIDLIFDQLPASIGHIRAGTLRALAITGRRRAAELPDVPTLAEAGVPGVEATSFFGLSAPAGTPDAVVEILRAAMAKAAATEQTRQNLSRVGAQPIGGSAAELDRMFREDLARWTKVIADGNITVSD